MRRSLDAVTVSSLRPWRARRRFPTLPVRAEDRAAAAVSRSVAPDNVACVSGLKHLSCSPVGAQAPKRACPGEATPLSPGQRRCGSLAALVIHAAAGAAGAACAACDAPCVTDAAELSAWVSTAQTARADIVCIGDSNQAFGGHGWDHGLTKAGAERFGLFATGLHSAGENLGQGLGLGYLYSILGTACCFPQFLHAGAPPALDALMSPDVFMYPMNYVYLPGGAAGASANLGLQVQSNCPVDVNAHLRYEVTYGLFAAQGGSFRLSIRLGQPPYSELVSGPPVSTARDSAALHMPTPAPWSVASLDLPAGARHAALNPRFTPWGVNITAPAIFYTQRLINLDRASGVSVSALYARGSQSARDMALGLLTASDEQLTLFFSRVRDAQGPGKAVLIRVNTGVNDLNETLPSLGPAQVTNPTSPEAFADNLLAIVLRLQGLWTSNGWNQSELFFLFSVSHPLSNPDLARLREYRGAAEALALTLPRTAVTRFDRLTNADEMIASGWYQSASSDRFHLTQAGFEALAAREIGAIIDAAAPPPDFTIRWSTIGSGGGVSIRGSFSPEGTASWEGGRLNPSCPGDLDANNTVNTLDLIVFLGRLGTANPCADFNADGTVDTLDLVVLLGNYGLTCRSTVRDPAWITDAESTGPFPARPTAWQTRERAGHAPP